MSSAPVDSASDVRDNATGQIACDKQQQHNGTDCTVQSGDVFRCVPDSAHGTEFGGACVIQHKSVIQKGQTDAIPLGITKPMGMFEVVIWILVRVHWRNNE